MLWLISDLVRGRLISLEKLETNKHTNISVSWAPVGANIVPDDDDLEMDSTI